MHRKTVSGNNICNGRNRNRKDSVLTANSALTFIKFGNNDIFDVKCIQTYSNGHNVNDGIYSANFVEVDFIQRLIVSFAFCFGNDLEDLQCDIFCTFCKTAVINDGLNIMKISMVMMVMMTVIMPVVMMVMVVMMFVIMPVVMMLVVVMMFVVMPVIVVVMVVVMFMIMPMVMMLVVRMTMKVFHIVIVVFVCCI